MVQHGQQRIVVQVHLRAAPSQSELRLYIDSCGNSTDVSRLQSDLVQDSVHGSPLCGT